MLDTQEKSGHAADSTREWAENAEDNPAELGQRNGTNARTTAQEGAALPASAALPMTRSSPFIHGKSTLTKPPATRSQMLQSKLVNRKPIRCAVCDCYISTFTGLPVILDNKARIIEFVHPSCCEGKT
jgi:hypothetical protein